MLEIRDLHAYYGKSHILQGVDLTVGDGEIVSLLGRNGVGRSTTCKAIMGLVSPQGSITFKGRAIAGLKPEQIAHAVRSHMSCPASRASSASSRYPNSGSSRWASKRALAR